MWCSQVSDIGFAFIYASIIGRLFSWPALALFALWEEALPFVDFIPSATLGWILTVGLGIRSRAAPSNVSLRGTSDTLANAFDVQTSLGSSEEEIPFSLGVRGVSDDAGQFDKR